MRSNNASLLSVTNAAGKVTAPSPGSAAKVNIPGVQSRVKKWSVVILPLIFIAAMIGLKYGFPVDPIKTENKQHIAQQKRHLGGFITEYATKSWIPSARHFNGFHRLLDEFPNALQGDELAVLFYQPRSDSQYPRGSVMPVAFYLSGHAGLEK